MNWVSVVCSMVAAACLTLAVVHFEVWRRDRTSSANLTFSLLALSVACFTWAEFQVMRTRTPEEFGVAIRWIHIPIFMMVAGIVAFVWQYLGTGRASLGHAAWMLRALNLAANVWHTPNVDYDSITAVRLVTFLGEPVAVGQGVTSWWHWQGQVSYLCLLAFVIDASVTLWREGGQEAKRRAAWIGGTLALFVLMGAGSAALLFAGVIQIPHVEFLMFLPVVGAMAYQLSGDVLERAQLARRLLVSEAELREGERRMTMASEAARLGMWMWDLDTDAIWATAKCRELFALPSAGDLNYESFIGCIHPSDRSSANDAIRRSIQAQTAYEAEYRVLHSDGAVRWIAAHGRVEAGEPGRPTRVLGVCIDVTEQREAERAAHDLSGRVITAQEDERRRIARDLHDDLSQRLVLLSVDVEHLGRVDAQNLASGRLARVAAQVRELATEIHKLSYQLHPAKLDQLGLEAAARSWCRDLSRQSGVHVDFAAEHVPLDLPADVALCLYRVVQESTNNVIRHSGASSARVRLAASSEVLRLEINDVGRGFDLKSLQGAAGLGLVGMRERVRLVSGRITIQSRPAEGTRIEVTVPLARRPEYTA